jgi:hypothetical protein
MVKYCNQVCQSIDWERGHRNTCMEYQSYMKPQVTHGLNVLLYDRTFGGKYSIYQHHMFRDHGPGIVVCDLSHEGDAFALSRGAPDLHRRVRFSYAHSAAQIRELNQQFARARHIDDADFTVLEGQIQSCSLMTARLYPGCIFVLVLRSPSGDFLAYMMSNWLSQEHPARLLPVAADFDYEQEDERQVVGNEFYEECMAQHRERRQARGDEKSALHPRWGGITPPLALQVDIRKAPDAPDKRPIVRLYQGSRVCLHSLSAAHLNGAVCEILGPADAANARIMVRVLLPPELAAAHPNPLSVKRENLTAEHLPV